MLNKARILALGFVFAAVIFASNAYAQNRCEFVPKQSAEREESWTLKRGINLSGSWRGDKPKLLTENEYRGLRRLGMTFVRLPVAEQALENEGVEHALRCDITSLLNNGLAVVLDFHPSKHLKPMVAKESPEFLEERLISYWEIMKAAVDGLPTDKVYISMLNEPPKGIDNWWEMQGRILEKMRSLFPENMIIVTASQGYYRAYKDKQPYADENVIYDFHFYQPQFFTHHNASWLKTPLDPREKTDNLRYPSALEIENTADYTKMQKYVEGDWNKEKLAEHLNDGPIAWSKERGAKIACLEFGVLKYYVDKSSRYRWLRDIRELFEENDIPWAMWDYNGGFGLYNKNRNGLNVLDMSTADALGLGLE